MGLKVYKQCCNNCLLSEDRIVSAKRAKEIIGQCTKEQTYFICHKASMEGKEIVCQKFYETMGYKSQMVRIAQRLDAIEFVDQTDNEKFIPYRESSKRIKNLKL